MGYQPMDKNTHMYTLTSNLAHMLALIFLVVNTLEYDLLKRVDVMPVRKSLHYSCFGWPARILTWAKGFKVLCATVTQRANYSRLAVRFASLF